MPAAPGLNGAGQKVRENTSRTPPRRMFARNPRVIETQLEHELILLDPATGQMFSLNDTGQRIWRALPAESALAVARQLEAALEVDLATAERDVHALLDRLHAAELIDVTGRSGSGE